MQEIKRLINAYLSKRDEIAAYQAELQSNFAVMANEVAYYFQKTNASSLGRWAWDGKKLFFDNIPFTSYTGLTKAFIEEVKDSTVKALGEAIKSLS